MRLPRLRQLLCLFLLLAGSISARAEIQLSLFTGVALTPDNDLTLKQAGGTDLTFRDVSYEGRDFKPPVYYGARLLWFANENSPWGFGAEFFHLKLYAHTHETTQVTGERNGVPVNGDERIDDTIERFNISHGLNYALVDVIYRFSSARRGPGFPNFLQPYLGLGLGAAIPHVESKVDGKAFAEYQLHGPAMQGVAGVNVDLTRHWGVMLEYKLTYAHLGEMEIPNGSIEITPLTHNVVAGITLRF